MKPYKTTKAQYNYFKQRCTHYIKEFGMIGYDIDFKWENCSERGFDCAYSSAQANYRATIVLDTEITNSVERLRENWKKEIDDIARHECIHVLMGRFSINAQARYINKNEIDEAEEELVRTLEKLIKV